MPFISLKCFPVDQALTVVKYQGQEWFMVGKYYCKHLLNNHLVEDSLMWSLETSKIPSEVLTGFC